MKYLFIGILFAFLPKKPFTAKSLDFAEGHNIQSKFTCDAQNISPGIVFENIPKKTKFFAIIMDDTESPNGEFVHWVLFNIPKCDKIEENTAPGVTGKNSLGINKYFGPCPPNGIHTYHFKVYAVKDSLAINNNVTKTELLKALSGQVLAESQFTGKYMRKQ
ncbi:MAG: YbhB/YbcL family Raf kinase inhibitor-like protein [Sphingobacteriaceae bacterium]|nr:YbhB/YbcL family Raf kinase inhibitor-like protein [Sphingobacteriaceae bacterium]